MKFSALSLGICAFAVVSTNAQYFSAGWAPGQPVPSAESTPANAGVPPHTASTGKVAPQRPSAGGVSSFFDLTTLLSSPLAESVFSKFGVNITERLASATEKTKVWDPRVPLITDDNYQDLIVNEPLNAQEEEDRTWILVISVTAGSQDGISLFVDQIFDAAFNETEFVGDLPNVRWGRIDYLNVTAITTKWSIWNAPYLVILKDRGQTLRFYRPHNLRLKADALRAFLQNEDWKLTMPWSSAYAPGGDREWMMDYLAFVLTKVYNTFIMVPRWLLLLLSGSVASFLINLLHKTPATPTPSQQSETTAPATASGTEAAAESTATPSASKATKRKKVKGRA
ncbi:hypothetical protein H0H92_004391 [Tricholoma furcatifolium]|nr:hypothetical protein H0H92_004391 [Tricholoma furcatifolium]